MINADNRIGMSSSGVDNGQASTGISNPRVKNPTAMCAIGEILITTGERVTTHASLHRPDEGATRQAGTGFDS
jgi:hypothetical protein